MLKKDTLKTKEKRQSFKVMDVVKLIALLIPVVQLLRQMKKGRK
ncbi:hypothetical protein Javan249_0052 [Streptococcus phage Javan249]|nr:hypothetical protein [Streptococcus halotolerans]QBX16418.1 hypothetical protein Javan249_0052 [Streptococcus phage Javan249]